MADKDTAPDEKADQNDTAGHSKMHETLDEDTEARMRAGVRTSEKGEEDDVAGHSKMH
jgi:hypothetical protein